MARKGKIMAHTDKLLSLVDQFPQAFSGTAEARVQSTPVSRPASQSGDGVQASHKLSAAETGASPPEAEPRDVPQSADGAASQGEDDQNTAAEPLNMTQNTQNVIPLKRSQRSQPQLLSLMQEFPQAFAAPQESSTQAATASDSQTNQGVDSSERTVASDVHQDDIQRIKTMPPAETSAVPTSPAPEMLNTHGEAGPDAETALEGETEGYHPAPLPGEYDQALQRQIPTFTWGEVQVYFTYGPQGLRSLWVTVGKSGTEVQSLCEAISRLINLLLAQQVPVPDICRQIRGIRGSDSEGLGPNRILGLADLIGKALQEAPEVLSPKANASGAMPQQAELDEQATPPTTVADHITEQVNHETVSERPQVAENWTIPEQGHLTAMLCPECGAELHHMNGCSGGACQVCGYSSCS